MKRYNPSGKNPLRFVFAACAVLGGVKLLDGVLPAILPLILKIPYTFSPSEAATIGIIGGADGPTAIFVTTQGNPWISILVGILLLTVGILGYLRFRKAKEQN